MEVASAAVLASWLAMFVAGPCPMGERAGAETRVRGIDLAAVARIRADGFQALERTRETTTSGRKRRRTVSGLGYTGHQFDPETGLVYARARYYDPETGVFLSRDSFEMPITAAPHLHRFLYAEGNPTMYRDENGHFVPLIVVGAMLIAAEIDFWKQQNANQTSSPEEVWSKTSFGEVGVAAAAGGAAALTGIAAGAVAAAGAGALGVGTVGTGIAAGAVGGGITAGLDSLSGQAIDVEAGRAKSIDWDQVGTSTAIGMALGGALGGVASKVSAELDAFGNELGNAAAEGLQAGAAEVAGVTNAVAAVASADAGVGAGGGAVARGVAQVVEAADAPGAAPVPAPAEQSLLGPGNQTTRSLAEIRRLRGKARWRAAEQHAQETYGSPGQRHFPVPQEGSVTGSGGRYVDAPVDLPNGGVLANEVKMYQGWRTVAGFRQQGSVPLTPEIEQQVLKDALLRNTVYDPRWLFYDAPPSSELEKLLADKGIAYVVHH